MNDTMNMSVSSIYSKNGKKYAFVSFVSGSKEAEGTIPDCKITKNTGFSEEEVAGLELYMKHELVTLKEMAANVRMIDAFIK